MKLLDFFKEHKSKFLFPFFSIIICLTTFIFAARGLERSHYLHPDEHTISYWVFDFLEKGYISSRLYPEGLYVLTKPILNIIDKNAKSNNDLELWEQSQNTPYKYENFSTYCDPYLFVNSFRWINVTLLIIATFCFFLLAYKFFNSIVVATIGGIILGCNFLLIEHAHYAESDIIGMLFSLLTMCAICWHLKKDNWLTLILGAFLGGFAFSCKFSNAPLLILLCFLFFRKLAFSLKSTTKKQKKAFILLFFIFCFVVLLLGILIGLPHLYLDYHSFIRKAQFTTQKTYNEIVQILSVAKYEPYAKLRANFSWLLQALTKFGLFIQIFWALSIIPLVTRKDNRKYILIFYIYPIFYVIFALFKFPFLRDQELIPLVPFILFASLFFAQYLINLFNRNKFIGTLGAIVVAIFTIYQTSQGIKMSSAFKHIDTSIFFANWVKTHIVPDANIYKEPRSIGKSNPSKIERVCNKEFCSKYDFVVRSPQNRKRGVFNPITGERFPEMQKKFDYFLENASLTTSCDHKYPNNPVFGALPVELWTINNSLATNSNNTSKIYRNLISGGSDYYVSPNNNFARVFDCLKLTGQRSRIRLGISPKQKYWAVVRLEYADEPQEVKWNNFFIPKKAKISPKHTKFFTLSDFAWINSYFDIWPSFKVRIKGNEATSLAWVYVTDNPAQVTSLLEETQDFDELARFKEENHLTNHDIDDKKSKLVDSELFNTLYYEDIKIYRLFGSKKFHADIPCILGPGKYKFNFLILDSETNDNNFEISDFNLFGANSNIKCLNLEIKTNKIYSEIEIEAELEQTDSIKLEFSANRRFMNNIKTIRIY